jgi:hypothetical protein
VRAACFMCVCTHVVAEAVADTASLALVALPRVPCHCCCQFGTKHQAAWVAWNRTSGQRPPRPHRLTQTAVPLAPQSQQVMSGSVAPDRRDTSSCVHRLHSVDGKRARATDDADADTDDVAAILDTSLSRCF